MTAYRRYVNNFLGMDSGVSVVCAPFTIVPLSSVPPPPPRGVVFHRVVRQEMGGGTPPPGRRLRLAGGPLSFSRKPVSNSATVPDRTVYRTDGTPC